jgi:integrase
MKRVRSVQWSGDRGEGSVFFFVDAETGQKISRNLYVAYWAAGKEQLLSAKTDDLDDAKRELKRLLRNRENAREGKEVLITPKTERVTVGELLDANLRRADRAGLASLPEIRYQSDLLRALLGEIRAVDFRPEHADRYRERRLRGEGSRYGAKVGEKTVQNELAVLRKAFHEAVRRGVLRFAPYIEMPGVSPERKKEIPIGVFFSKVLPKMTDADARDFVEWMLLTARRPKGIGALRWEWWDQERGTIQMPPEKGGNPTVFSVRGMLAKVFERRVAARRLDCPFIFHREGEPMDDENVRPFFYEALEAAEIPTGRAGFTLYDTKKTAMGVMVDAGLSVEEIMAFSGHRDRAMVERYVVRNADRQAKSVARRDAFLRKALSQKKRGSDSERVAVFPRVRSGNS